MVYSTQPDGPWSEPVMIPGKLFCPPIPSSYLSIDDIVIDVVVVSLRQPFLVGTDVFADSNFAPFILQNGSVVGLMRTISVFAEYWKDVSTYKVLGPFHDKGPLYYVGFITLIILCFYYTYYVMNSLFCTYA